MKRFLGPVVTIYVYDEDKFEETLDILDQTSDYALTGLFLHNVDMLLELLQKNYKMLQETFTLMISQLELL